MKMNSFTNILDCVKSVHIRSFFVPNFSVFGLATDIYSATFNIILICQEEVCEEVKQCCILFGNFQNTHVTETFSTAAYDSSA